MTTPTDPTTLRTALEALADEALAHGKALYGDRWTSGWLRTRLDAIIIAALATPTPAATEERCGCGLGRQQPNAKADALMAGLAERLAPPTAPATEPVAALGLCQWTPTTEPCLGDPDDWRHRRCLPEGDPCPDPCPAMPGCHPYTPVAARAEVDVERLARFVVREHPTGAGDWACAECMVARDLHSDLIRDGYRCTPHAAAAYQTALAARTEGRT